MYKGPKWFTLISISIGPIVGSRTIFASFKKTLGCKSMIVLSDIMNFLSQTLTAGLKLLEVHRPFENFTFTDIPYQGHTVFSLVGVAIDE